MDRAKIEQLINTFYVCDKRAILQVIQELLSAIEAEESLPPGILMSRNYETAQANPEIHTLPGNLKDARDAIFPYFWGTDGWFSKLHLENVKGPANYASLLGAFACLLKNPNLCTDTYSQRANELEVKAITALANLLFYYTDKPWGVFTMGGTISNLYGGKLGIEKVIPGAMHTGLQGARLAGLVSEAAHYSNATLAGWLGMGTENLHSITTDSTLAMRLECLADKLEELYSDGAKVAFVIGTFGSTDAFGIDDIGEIRRIITEKANAHGEPVPQFHVDAAVGWALCFLTEYNIEVNPFGLEERTLPLIKRAQQHCNELRHADSVTIDFHKWGWGHYPSSAFIVNRRDDLVRLFRTKEELPYFTEADYRRDPALFTLECSRPGIGPFSVIASLNAMGLTGYQMLVANAIELANSLKHRIEALDYCKILNMDTIGPSVVWWVLPKGRDAKLIYSRMVKGELDAEECSRYLTEVRRLFDKRQAMLNSAIDARLSFTSAMGFEPNGIPVPGWKAVFFNPKTDESVVERIVDSIEELM